jgi:hypothetical protein
MIRLKEGGKNEITFQVKQVFNQLLYLKRASNTLTG